MRAVVTGAARGIGRAIARRLARDSRQRDGAPIGLLISDQHEAELETLAGELRESGAVIVTLVADLSDPSVPARMIDAAATRFGGIDVICANAGYAVGKTLMDFAIEDWDRNFAVHTRGPWLMAKAAHAHLKASAGRFILTASISGSHATPALGAYSPSKAATLMLMRQLAVEWGPDGIRVNAVSPGLTHTSGTAVVYDDPEIKRLRGLQIPLRRVAEADEMASVVSFLAGPDASYVHGADIVVDGGLANCLMPNLGMADAWANKVTGTSAQPA